MHADALSQCPFKNPALNSQGEEVYIKCASLRRPQSSEWLIWSLLNEKERRPIYLNHNIPIQGPFKLCPKLTTGGYHRREDEMFVVMKPFEVFLQVIALCTVLTPS